jgi:RND family efflux transporter MFP subunit
MAILSGPSVSFLFRRALSLSAVVVGGVLLSACSDEKAETAPEIIRPVKIMTVAESRSSRALDYSGTIRARTETALGFRVSGKITDRLVDVGDHVETGETLARIDTTDYALSVRSAEANLAATDRQVETADLARERAKTLFSREVSSKSQLEQADLVYNQAVATRDAARSALEQARNQVSYGALTADRSGIVTAVSAEVGQVVSAGAPVVTVAADGDKEVLIAVPETDILAFRPGKSVDVTLWASEGRTLPGTVREIAGSADARSRTFAVRVSVPDGDGILLGMTARVAATEDTGRALVSIPLAALAKNGDASIVWTIAPGSTGSEASVTARTVTVADYAGADVRIAQGLSPGDRVVTAGTQFMREDLKVKLPGIVTDPSRISLNTAR